MNVTVEFELSDDVAESSKYSLAIQLGSVIEKALEEYDLDIPDGEIEDFSVYYEEAHMF